MDAATLQIIWAFPAKQALATLSGRANLAFFTRRRPIFGGQSM